MTRRSRYRIAFFGTPHFALPTLAAILSHPEVEVVCVVTQPDRHGGRGHRLLRSPVKDAAEAASLPVLQPTNIRRESKDFLAELSAYRPFDGAVVVAFGQILPAEVLSFFDRNCINVHASLLPKYRGAAPIQYALLNGDPVSGATLMAMDEGMDTGGIYAYREVAILESWVADDLHDALAAAGASLVACNLPAILSRSVSPVPQDDMRASYAPKITPSDAVLPVTSQPARSLHNRIRALSSRPGAYALAEGKRLKILRSEVLSANVHLQQPGSFLPDSDHLDVWCVDASILRALEVQLEGGKRISGQEFRRGYPRICRLD